MRILAGVVATLIYFGAAELIATALDSSAAPLLILGETIIPLTPTSMIRAAIAVFGTYDKIALVIIIVVIGALLGGAIGRLGARAPVR